MRRIESLDDQMRGIVTFELEDGRRAAFAENFVRLEGLAGVRAQLGIKPSTRRIPVTWHGRTVGTLPDEFDPHFIKSNNFFYDPRPGDFVRDGDNWVANKMLGPGDLEAVPGFVWEPR